MACVACPGPEWSEAPTTSQDGVGMRLFVADGVLRVPRAGEGVGFRAPQEEPLHTDLSKTGGILSVS